MVGTTTLQADPLDEATAQASEPTPPPVEAGSWRDSPDRVQTFLDPSSGMWLDEWIYPSGPRVIDAQSASGKVIHGVANYAKAQDIPVVVIAGSIGSGAQAVYPLGVNTLIALPESPTTLDDCIQNAAELLSKAADRVFSLLKIGKDIK